MKHLVHKTLKRRGRITEPEGHHYEFVEAPLGGEGRFEFVTGFHRDLMVTRA
jgi:hypothetical protein